MRYKMIVLVMLAALLASGARAATLSEVVKVRAGVGGAWFDGDETITPADVEAVGVVSASLSPHISVIAAAAHGFDADYNRFAFGPRITITDVNNPNFSVGLGVEYQVLPGLDEWGYTANVGWVPLASRWPRLSLVGQGEVGSKSGDSRVTLGARYLISLP